MHFPFDLILHYPKLRAVAFFVLSILFISLLIYDWDLAQSSPDAPEFLTIDQAAERAHPTDLNWVEIQDAQQLNWDCSTLTYWESTVFDVTSTGMEITVTNPEKSIVMVVSFNYRMTCEQLLARDPALRGQLKLLSDADCDCDGSEEHLAQYDQSSTFLKLYTAYEPPSQGEHLVLIAFTVFSLLGSLQGFYAGFIRRRKPEPVADVPRDPSLPRPLDKL